MRKKERRPMRRALRWSIARRSALRKKNNPNPPVPSRARHQEVCIYMEANNFSSYIFSDHAPPTFQSFQPPAVQRTRHTTLLLHPGRGPAASSHPPFALLASSPDPSRPSRFVGDGGSLGADCSTQERTTAWTGCLGRRSAVTRLTVPTWL
jgi:hypothetical protein